MFRHRRQLRRWAAQVLLLWLFGVGTGLANACLAPKLAMAFDPLSTPAASAAGAHHHASTAAHSHHGEPDQASQDVDTADQQGSPSRTNCQDFCDKSSATIPSLKLALDDLQGHALPLSTAAPALWAAGLRPMLSWLPRRDGVRVTSIPIVFLRLTL